MDPITHGLLGAATARSLFTKKVGKSIGLVGALAAMAADLDIVIRSSQDPFLLYIYHRHFSHSLFFAPFGGLIVGLLFLLVFKRYRSQWRYVLLVAIIAYFTHPLLDACTSYGTLLWWPWSMQRISWDIISIVDPVFTLILLLGVVFSLIKKSAIPARFALLLASMYLLLGCWQHYRALGAQLQLIESRHQKRVRGRVMPTLGQIFIWRSVYLAGGKFYVDTVLVPLWARTTIESGFTIAQYAEPLPQSIQQNSTWVRDFQIFEWFSDNYLGVVNREPLTLADMRFVYRMQPPRVIWVMQFPENKTRSHALLWMNQELTNFKVD